MIVVSNHNAKWRAHFEAQVTNGPAPGRAILASMGKYWAHQKATVAADLLDCRAKCQTAFIWFRPEKEDFTNGLTMAALPNDPAIKELNALLAVHGAPVVLHLLSEFAQYKSYANATGAEFCTAFDAIAAQMPNNVICEASIEGNQTVGMKIPIWDLPSWLPSKARLVGVDAFAKGMEPNTAAYTLNTAWADLGAERGLPCGIAESGFNHGDVTDPAQFKPVVSRVLKLATRINATYLTFLNNDWGGYPAWDSGLFTSDLPAWAGCPEGVTMLRDKLTKSGAMMTAPAVIGGVKPLVTP